MTDDDIHASAAPYAVGALPSDEVAGFETHLSDCAQCQAEVGEYAEVTAALSESVAVEPPAGLRVQVLSAIADIPQEPAGSTGTVESTEAAASTGRHAASTTPTPHGADKPSVDVATVTPLRRSRANKALAVLAAAAVLAAVAFGGWALKSRNDALDRAEDEAARSSQLVAVATAPDAQHQSAAVNGGGTATVLRSKSAGTALLLAADLPVLPNGKTYEAWTIGGGGASPVPAGTFESSGAHTAVELPAAAVSTPTVAVTVEPDGGSTAPTTQPIVAITLS